MRSGWGGRSLHWRNRYRPQRFLDRLRLLREAVDGEHSGRLMLMRYETLTAYPLGTFAAIHGFIGEALYREHIEPDYAAMEFDAGSRPEPQPRPVSSCSVAV